MLYDATGDLVKSTDEKGRDTLYAYDARDNLTRITHPDPDLADPAGAPTTSYSYDTEGNLVSETDTSGLKTSYTYDKLTRLIGASSNQ